MRIIGNIDHPHYKITVFQTNQRIALKIEDQLLEQTFKFRDGTGIENTDDVKRLLDSTFLGEVSAIFDKMSKALHTTSQRNDIEDEGVFEDFI